MLPAKNPDDAQAPSLPKRINRFLIIGLANIAVDLSAYSFLLYVSTAVPLAKGIAFIAGTVFAFVANRTWTFNAGGTGMMLLIPFALLYGLSAILNVTLNSAVLSMLGGTRLATGQAYVVATGASALLNFIGMQFIFLRNRSQPC